MEEQTEADIAPRIEGADKKSSTPEEEVRMSIEKDREMIKKLEGELSRAKERIEESKKLLEKLEHKNFLAEEFEDSVSIWKTSAESLIDLLNRRKEGNEQSYRSLNIPDIKDLLKDGDVLKEIAAEKNALDPMQDINTKLDELKKVAIELATQTCDSLIERKPSTTAKQIGFIIDTFELLGDTKSAEKYKAIINEQEN